MTSKHTPFSKIIIELKKLCENKATGTLFIVTKKNRGAQIMIENGEIVFIYFFNKTGQEALEFMSTIQSGTYRFQKGKVTARRIPLPKTSSILQTLAGVVGQSNLEIESTQSVSEDVKSLNHEQKTVLKECLAEFIGPMAAIVCEDHFESAVDFSTAVNLLAAEISSADQRGEFRKKVTALQTPAGVVDQSSLEIESAQSVSGDVKSLNHKQKTVLKECLAEYIGPIAAIVCEDHFESAVDFPTAVNLLAAKISSADQRKEFRKKVMAKIR